LRIGIGLGHVCLLTGNLAQARQAGNGVVEMIIF
jgi:hypothetical protein